MTDQQLSQAMRLTMQSYATRDAAEFQAKLTQRMRDRLTSRKHSNRETDWPLRSPFVTTSKRGVVL